MKLERKLYQPSWVYLIVPPLTGTLGHTEIEVAAGAIIAYLASTDDKWHAVNIDAMIKWAIDQAKKETFALTWSEHFIHDLISNPYCRPGWKELVSKGFAIGYDGPVYALNSIELTQEAHDAITPWVPLIRNVVKKSFFTHNEKCAHMSTCHDGSHSMACPAHSIE